MEVNSGGNSSSRVSNIKVKGLKCGLAFIFGQPLRVFSFKPFGSIVACVDRIFKGINKVEIYDSAF